MSDVQSLLPPNATALERAIEQSLARLDGIDVELINTVWNPATCPAALLPWLAWALSVNSWDSTWPEATKRAVIAASPAIHRRKGTAGAVRRAVEALGGAVVFKQWFETTPPGAPYTFSLVLSVTGAPGEEADGGYVDAVIAAIESAKNARSHYTFTTALLAYAPVGVVGAGRVVGYRRMQFEEAA